MKINWKSLFNKKRARKTARILVIVLLVSLVFGGPAWLYMKLAAGDFNERILSFALEKANQRLEGKLEIEELMGNPFDWVSITDIRVLDAEGNKVIEISEAVVSYELFKDGEVSPRLEIKVEDSWVKAEKQGEKWNLSRLRKKRPSTGGPASYPPIFGKVDISSLEVTVRTAPEKIYNITVPQAAGSFNTKDNSVGFEIEDFSALVTPPEVPVTKAAVSGRAFNTGAGWDVRIHGGNLESQGSYLRIGQGRYFTGTSEIEARIPELNLTPETLRAAWQKNPLKKAIKGSADISGDIRNIGFQAEILSSTGSLAAGGTYGREDNVLDMEGQMKNFTLQDFIDRDVPLSKLFGKFDLRYQIMDGDNPRRLYANLALDSFAYPRIKPFPVTVDMELSGESYQGSVVSRSEGRDFNSYVSGKITRPYPFDLQAMINDLDPAAFVDGQPQASLAGELQLRASGTSTESFRGEGSLRLKKSTISKVEINDARLVYSIAKGRFRAESLRALTDVADVEGTGWIRPFDKNLPYSFEAKAGLNDPALAGELTGGKLSVKDADLDAKINGDRHHWKAAGEARVTEIKAPGLEAKSALIKTDISGKGVRSIEGNADLDMTAFYIPRAETGEIKWPPMNVMATAQIRPSPLKEPDVSFKVDTESNDPNYGVVSQGSFDMGRKSRFELALEKLDLTVIGQTWTLSSPARVLSQPSGISFEGVQLEKDKATLGAFGHIKENNSDLTLVVNQFDTGPWTEKLVPEKNIQGILSGSVSVSGKMSGPAINGNFGITGPRLADTRLDSAEGFLKYSEEKMNFSLRGRSELAGEIRLWGNMSAAVGLSPAKFSIYKDRPFDVQVDALDLSVGVLDYFIPWLTDLSGKASLDAHVRGTPAEPEWNGKTRLTNVSCKVPEWGLSLAGLNGSADIKENMVRIPEITVFSGDGRARLSGGFRIDNYSVSDLDLALRADNFKAMNTPDINASVDAKLNLRGDLDYPRFGGKVKFTELTYRPPLILAYQGTSWESPDPTIRLKGEESQVTGSSPLLDRGDLDIKIEITDQARLRNSELNVRFGGELRVRKPPGGFFLLFGDLETKDGWLLFQGKPFRIERGVFTFPAIPVIDPSLDILASYRVPDYTTYIKITGSLSGPSLEIYSDPPLDPADVLSVILFGRPMSELARGEQETLAQTGGQLAASYAAANLASSLGMALDLDTIVVETGKTAEESGVGIGKYVNEKLYLYYFQQFGEEAAEEFRIRYEINKNFSIEATKDTTGQGGVDLYYTYTY